MNALDVIDKIRWFMTLPEALPGLPWDNEFESRAYIRWACNELIQEIMYGPSKSADAVIEEFWLRMLRYQHTAKSSKMRKIFQIAMDTADTIIAML